MNKSIKIKYTFLLLITFSIFLVFQTFAYAEYESTAGAAVLIEASTGKILYEKNADVPMPPASITKLMTLFLGFQAVKEGSTTWDDLVPISEKAWRTEGSRMFAEVGTKVKYLDIITGISVVSANDGCVALAEYLSGSEDAFVQEMNSCAEEFGLTQTQFKNSHGLPAVGHYMNARDISVLAQRLILEHPEILEIETLTEFTFNDIKQFNRNPLLGVYPGADGLKTGWTEEAGYCLVGTAKKDGMRMISVVLNTKNEEIRLASSQELLNYGFNNFEFVTVRNAGEIVEQVDVKKGKQRFVPVKIDKSITLLLNSSRKNDLEFNIKKDVDVLTAPSEKGTVIGKLDVLLDDEVLSSVSLSTSEDAVKAGFFELLFLSIGNFFHNIFYR